MRRRSLLSLSLAALALAGLESGLFAAALPLEVDFVGSLRWQIDDPAFGGWSGMELREDGTAFIAISDRSSVVEGTFTRNAEGRITAVAAGPIRPLTLAGGRPARLDSEGLALAADGRVFISEEARHRVAVSTAAGQDLAWLPVLPRSQDMVRNQSLEALAVDATGTVYTLPEFPRLRTAYPVYRHAGGAWTQPFALPRQPDWAAVGADFGPDGRFYLLERGFTKLGGFRSRIRVFSFSASGATEYPVLLETPFRQYGNLEGLSVWQDPGGYLRFTLISDDNFLPFGLYTDIVEYRARMPLAPADRVN